MKFKAAVVVILAAALAAALAVLASPGLDSSRENAPDPRQSGGVGQHRKFSLEASLGQGDGAVPEGVRPRGVRQGSAIGPAVYTSLHIDVAIHSLSIWAGEAEPYLERTTSERLNAFLPWDTLKTSHPVTYTPLFVSAMGDEDYIVCGEAAGGEAVIERWILRQPEGGWSARASQLTSSQLVAGSTFSPLPGTSPVQAVGGQFVPPSQRGVNPRFHRIQLFSGSIGPYPIQSVAADPAEELVFVLCSNADTGGGAVYELPLSSPLPHLVYEETGGGLLSRMDRTEAWFDGFGRWAITLNATASSAVIGGGNFWTPEIIVFERSGPGAALSAPILLAERSAWAAMYGTWYSVDGYNWNP
jgi:hypothetical protein